MNNRFNEVFPFFDSLNSEFALEARLIDIFSSCFLFHLSSNQSSNNIKSHICLLNEIALESFLDSTVALVVSNASIKNNIAMSISHIHIHNKLVIKTLYHTVNVMTTEAELFAIVKIVDGRLYFIFSFQFYFTFLFFFFSFSIFRTTRVRVYQSCCHISHKLMV